MSARVIVTPKTKQVLLEVPRAIHHFRGGIEEALYEIGQLDVNEARRLIRTGPKTGRVYIINGRRHRASAPGQPPANRTGVLAKQVDYTVRSYHEMEFGDTNPAFYGVFLENGTRRMKRRPHLLVAVNTTAGDATMLLQRLVWNRLHQR